MTPGGRLGAICAIFSFTRWMTAMAFSPVRMTTMPPTTSRPLTSSAPRRKSPPICTVGDVAQIDRRAVLARTARCCSRSSRLLTRPMPRTTNSIPFSSITLPPTLRLLSRDGVHHLAQESLRPPHLPGVHFDLILPHEAADARDLGHALTRLELVADEPILQRAQLPEIVAARAASGSQSRSSSTDRL